MSESGSPEGSPIIISKMDPTRHRYPCCIVWTPLPLLTWFIPFIGHMGIAYTSGVIRDFAGPYFVSEDNMAFGWPTKYWRLDPYRAQGGPSSFDRSITLASEEYQGRMHNLFCDNCHSHVAMALNLMRYDSSDSWNMVKLCFLMILHGKYVSFGGFFEDLAALQPGGRGSHCSNCAPLNTMPNITKKSYYPIIRWVQWGVSYKCTDTVLTR